MSALRLRDAATKLREVAEAATPGPWEAVVGMYDSECGQYEGAQIPTVTEDVSDYYIGTVPPLEVDDARFIATMHPPVALALADWLDYEVMRYELLDLPVPNIARSLAVADTILGVTT